MSTSLAEQLKRLAVPQTTLLKRDKKRASLLFDPKEAAGLNRETVYQIGLEGLDELVSKNAAFEQFRNSLFHITSKNFERAVQDVEANKKLNKCIRKFILHLSPYFLLNCTHKALEWLIQRYMINEYNREDLLMLILPYHESNIFVRVVQLLKFKDENDPWYFLKALQKPGVHLPKQSLLNHAASNSSFLKFVTQFIMQLLKEHEKPGLLTVPFNFYCSVFTGAIEYSPELKEDQVSQMLPLILNGLKSNIPDFCAASYVITARLLVKTSLSDKLLDNFVKSLTSDNVAALKTEATMVLLVLFQSQKEYNKMPENAVENVCKLDWMPKVLQDLNNGGSFIYPFLLPLVRGLVVHGTKNESEEARRFLEGLINQMKFEETCVATIIHSILDPLESKKPYNEVIKTWLTQLIGMLETQYPVPFDKEVYNILISSEEKKLLKRKKCLQKILKNSMLSKGKFDVFDKLYHPNPQFRTEALKYLKAHFKDLSDTDKELIKNSFIDRLNDDNSLVVQKTLNVLKKTEILDHSQFKCALIELIRKHKAEFEEVTKDFALTLCSICEGTDWEGFLVVFPYFIPSTPEDLTVAKSFLSSKFVQTNTFLNPVEPQLQNCKIPEDFSAIVIGCLQSNKSIEIVQDFVRTLHAVPVEKRDSLHKYSASIILANLLPENSTIEISSLVLDILLRNYQSCNELSEKDKKYVGGYMKTAMKQKFPVCGFLKCIESVILKTEKPQIDLREFDYSQSQDKEVMFVLLAKVLSSNPDVHGETFHLFLNKFCSNPEHKIEFLLNLCTSNNSNLDVSFPMAVLAFIIKDLKDNSEIVSRIVSLDSLCVPYMLTVLYSERQEIRKLTFDLIEILLGMAKNIKGNYYLVLEKLMKNQEEIFLDHEQLPLILFNLIAPENTKGKRNVVQLNLIRNTLVKLACDIGTTVYLQAGVLKLLSQINSLEIFEATSKVALDILENKPERLEGFKSTIVTSNLSRIEPNVLKKLTKSNIWNLILVCLGNETTLVALEDNSKTTPVVLVLSQLNKEVFAVLNDDLKKLLLDVIIHVATVASNPEVLPAASRVFKHIDLDAKLILQQITKMRDVRSPKVDQTKKRRVSVIPTEDILDTLDWREGVSVLEFIQDKKKIRNLNSLLVVLFEVLKKCLDFDEQAAVEYPKQLILSMILVCCSRSQEKIPENSIEMPLIVQCIRASQNPQTHHYALLVLAHVAELFPSQVLQHMIPIFTFVGSSVLRYDDAYSFQIMTRIVDTVIPILVADNQVNKIAKVLRDFVDALLDVPEHKRMSLYKQLLTKINVKENLYLFLLLVFESHVSHSAKPKSDKKRLEISANLCREFSPEVVIYTCIKLVKYLKELPDDVEENMEIEEECATFNVATYTAKQFRHYKFILVTFIGNLLSSVEFVQQVAVLSHKEILHLEDVFKDMIINILTYIQRVSVVTEKSSQTPQAQYWKTMLHHSYDILDSNNALLTPQMFLLVTRGLMVHKIAMVRKRALELLNNKLQFNSSFFTDCDKSEVYALIPPLTSIIESINNEQVEHEQEQIVQIALLSLKLMVRVLASDDPEKFVQILDFISSLIRSGKVQNNVQASAVLCLGELCVNLRAHAISSLPTFMPAIIKVLKQQKTQETSSVLLLSVLTAVQKIFDSLPLFISPYLEKVLLELSLLMSKINMSSDDVKVQPFINKLNSIKAKIGSIIPSRVLIPAVEQCYKNLIERKCFNAISALMDILGENLANLKGAEVTSNLPDLTNFFLNALQFRADADCSLDEANLVESHIIKALTVLILKLSESSFRPMYYKLYDWAVRNEVKSERVITFYSLSSGIAQSLKGLFVLFAGHFLNNSAQILDACNKVKTTNLYFDDDQNNMLLLEYVLKTLSSVFLYDSQRFINKDRFDVLMQPLVDQLENTLGGLEALKLRNADVLTPCLVQFASAAADDALWKQMNYQILLKMRHDSSEVRLIALHCVTEIVKKLGEDFLPLLPETIPFLAELLEDEEESVEKVCKVAVLEMEKVLGESLQAYF